MDDLHDKAGSITDIIGAEGGLSLLAEGSLPLGRSQVNASELETGQGMVLGSEPLQECSDGPVARVYAGGGHVTPIDQSKRHDTTRNRAAHPTGAANSATKSSSQARNQLTVDLQMLGDRQQDAFCSIETGGGE